YAGGMWTDNVGNLAFGWSDGTGAPATTQFYVNRSGVFTVAGTLQAGTNVLAPSFANSTDTSFSLGFISGGAKHLQFQAGYEWFWQTSTGTLMYYLNGSQLWIMRNDNWCYNNLGYVGGKGPYQDLSSDERTKVDVVPATY